MKLLLVRHGQTLENAQHIMQGHLPGHLSELGIQQSKDLAEQLKDESIDQVWSSDLKRCVDTANHLIKFHPGLKLHTSTQLREINYGDFQGKKVEDLDWSSLQGPLLQQRFPHGETRQEMADRAVAFINQLRRDFPDQTILIVTHGGPARVIMCAVEGVSLAENLDRDAINAQAAHLEVTKELKL